MPPVEWLSVFSYRSLRRADHSSRGVLPRVYVSECVSVISQSRPNPSNAFGGGAGGEMFIITQVFEHYSHLVGARGDAFG